jgi:hypothetical protein
MYQIGHKSSIDKGVSHLVDYRNESLHIYLLSRISWRLKYSSTNTLKYLVVFMSVHMVRCLNDASLFAENLKALPERMERERRKTGPQLRL